VDGATLTAILSGKDAETSYSRISNQQLFDGPLNYIRLVTDRNNNEQSFQSILSKIQGSGPPLVTVAEIVQGIVTGANQATDRQIQQFGLGAAAGDGIFVLSEDEVHRLHLNKVEAAFIKPWFKNSDIDRWVTARETEKRLIYIRADSEVDEDAIPNLLRHFKQFKPQLINRNVRTGSITVKQYDDFVRGRGDVPYVMIKSAFAAGRFYCVSYARDRHVFAGEKIVCPQFSPLNTFAFDDREWFAASDVYFIKNMRGSKIDLKYLLALLNSRLCYFWLYYKGQRKGDLLQLFKGPLSEIPVASPGNHAGAAITLVDHILAKKRRNAEADTSTIEREIDQLIYAVYDLTPAEIELVERAT
jgi:adenine-specific DNA-methyltransferase